MDKRTFLSIAKAFGLKISDPHIEELYHYVQKTLLNLQGIKELDLRDIEPTPTLVPFLSLEIKKFGNRLIQRPREKRDLKIDSNEIYYLSVGQLAHLIQKKELSPVEVIQAHLSRIEDLEPKLNSFITLRPEQAIEEARKAEKKIQKGQYLGPLHGIPFGLKDIFYVKGIRNTSGSKIFDHFIPDFDCTLFNRLRKAGAIFLGKLNLHPFAYGVTGENEEYGHMHNPYNPILITGGSSGGCASAVASGECSLAIGSDTGGSIRIPSALCGLVGLKPTYGLISRYGMTPLAWSQDHPGPMARSVKDCALILNAVAGYDPNDPTSIPIPIPDYTKALTQNIKGLRLGVIKEFFKLPIDPKVRKTVTEAFDQYRELGATISELTWPFLRYATPIASIIQSVEATAYYGKLIKERASEIYPPVRLRLESGIFFSGIEYIQAQRARLIFYRESLDLLNKVDLLVCPTVPVTAFPIGTSKIKLENQNLNIISLLTQYTRPFNLNGFPAITVPCGFSKDGLPTGLQLIGRPFHEETLLRAAYAYEQVTQWNSKKPSLSEL